MRPWLASLAAFALFASLPSHAARAEEGGRFALDLSGVRYGFVQATTEREKGGTSQPQVLIIAQDVSSPLVALVDGFTQGKPIKRDVRLTSGAVVRKANDARLVAVKLPALGSGGAPDVELAFAIPSLTTQPLLSAKEPPPAPASARITDFRVDLTGMRPIDAPKLDAITITQKPDGSATTGSITLEVGAGGAPPFVAWQKASVTKPTPRTFRVEYVGVDGAAILKLQLERCAPTAVTPLGASGTTRVTLACGAVRSG
jgi:hypothetical protein